MQSIAEKGAAEAAVTAALAAARMPRFEEMTYRIFRTFENRIAPTE